MRVAVTIAECPQGSGRWKVVSIPSYDVDGHKALVDELVQYCERGQDRILVLSSRGVIKRKKMTLCEVKDIPAVLKQGRSDAKKSREVEAARIHGERVAMGLEPPDEKKDEPPDEKKDN